MIDESKQDLVVQYVLGELDPPEADEVRAQLRTDSELREFASQMEETFASMAYSPSPMRAPADIPQRILQAERRKRQATPSVPPRSKIVWAIFVPWALAACLAIVCGFLGLERARMEKDLASLREKDTEVSKEFVALQQKDAEVSKELAALQQKDVEVSKGLAALQQKNAQSEKELAALKEKDVLSGIKIATLKAQVAAYQQATAVVVWDKDKRTGVLQLDKLPPPGAGKDYQLWVIDSKNPQPVSAGVLSVPNNGLVRASFHPVAPVESASVFAISVEKSGGASKPEGQIILVGK